jgi:hypothetical protein
MIMIKFGVKGKIIKGDYSNHGELLLEDDTNGRTGGYYIYIWPNDGTKWPESQDDMVYDIWVEKEKILFSYFKEFGGEWEVEWYDDQEEINRVS